MPAYKKISSNIQQLTINNPNSEGKLIWLNIANPEKKEIEYLRKKYNFDLGHLHASSSKVVSERPIVNNERDYFFMILHFPIFSEENIVPAEVDFFVSHGYLVTLHNNNLPALNNFFSYCKKEVTNLASYQFESSAILLSEILEKLIHSCYPLLDENGRKITEVEKLIFAQEQKKSASKILILKRNIINTKKIMQNHKNILKQLTNMDSHVVEKMILKKHYSRLVEQAKRIWEIIDLQKEMIDALHATNESFLNYKMSSIMKTLTIFSVIVFPLTLLAAIFSMRVEGGMPLLQNPFGFWVIIASMFLGATLMLWIFEKKKWL